MIEFSTLSNKPINVRFIFSFLFVLSSIFVFSQGQLLNKGESGGALYYGTFIVQSPSIYRPDERLKSLGFSIISKRVFEGGFVVSKLKDDGTFTPYIAGFADTDSPIDFKFSAAYNLVQDASNFPSFSGTMFLDARNFDWIVPSISITASKNETIYGGGIDFRIGAALNLIGGIFVLKYKDLDLTYGFNVGILFTNTTRVKPKDI